MLLGAAIMATIFSTFDNPAATLRQVLVGQALGVTGALICRWLVWPLANSEIGLVLSIMHFVVFGGLLLGFRCTAPIGFDYNIVVLLQPVWPLAGDFIHSLTAGAAVLLGAGIGVISFLSIFSVDGEQRVRTLIAMMVHDIEAMANRNGGSRHGAVWRATLYHRILQLIRWAGKNGAKREEVIGGSFAMLLSGSALLQRTFSRGRN
jgi:hypothetical protein